MVAATMQSRALAGRHCAAPRAPRAAARPAARTTATAAGAPALATVLEQLGKGLASLALSAALLTGAGAPRLRRPAAAPSRPRRRLTRTPSLPAAGPAAARLEGVNRPELLPPGPVATVIDAAGFLSEGQEARIAARVAALEAATGVRLRVLAQNYPETPGLAIRDYWAVDDDTVVAVFDPSFGNMVNVNVGLGADLRAPRNFWTRLASKYGVPAYWKGAGEDAAIVNAVAAIDACLREAPGAGQCAELRGELE
jgi:hypothetical protein